MSRLSDSSRGYGKSERKAVMDRMEGDLRSLGFAIEHTGGGVRAWTRIESGASLLLTTEADDGWTVPTRPDRPCEVHRVPAGESEPEWTERFECLADALAFLRKGGRA